MYKRIIATLAAIVITFTSTVTPVAKALSIGEAAYAYTQSSFAQWVVASGLTAAGYVIGGSLGTIALPGIGTVEGTALGTAIADGAALGFNELMEYLAEYPIDDAYAESEADYLTTLDSTTANSSIAVTGYSATSTGGAYDWLWSSSNSEFFQCLEDLDVNDKFFVWFINANYLVGYFFDEYGRFSLGIVNNPLGRVHSSAFGVYSLSDLTLVYSEVKDSSAPLFYSKEYAESYGNFVFSSCYAFDWDTGPYGSTGRSHYFYVKYSTNSTWSSSRVSYGLPYAIDVTVSSTYGLDSKWFPSDVSWDNSRIIVQPSGTDSSSRGSDLMEMISDYNKTNDYLSNNSAVNYFIGTVGADGTVTGVYNPSVYDEETLIFTEPQTGMQYQTTGWTYDYNDRYYELTLSPGTMIVNDTDVATVGIMYGDEEFAIGYADASGNVLAADKYAYVMVSQNECSINGHTNTVETTKEATCTAPGERTYTCSVCGNQTVEDIPQLEHTYADYTVQKEPTCTNKGLAANTCLTCGSEVTELLDALGHDWLPTSITDESWAMPDGVSCPDCHGTSFTHTRSDYYYVTAGKNLLNLDLDLFNTSLIWSGSPNKGDVFDLAASDIHFKPNMQYTVSLESKFMEQSGRVNVYLRVYYTDGSSSAYGDALIADSSKGVDGLFVYTTALGKTVSRIAIESGFGGNYEFSWIQIEEGSVATEYEPYKADEFELIPPIYNFTCNDCSATWDAEAVYQYAYTTFTCSRCGEAKIEANDEEKANESWFSGLIFKFNWLSSIANVYKQLVADVTSDAATAAAIADGTVMLADVTSNHAAVGSQTAAYTAPELAISFGASDKYGVDWANIKPLDLSWYAPYKETVDGIVSGMLWLSYLFLLIKRAPGIVRGSEMITEDRIKIDNWNFRHRR